LEEKNNIRVNAPRENEEAKTANKMGNFHPTVKPIKLMEYLCTLTKTPTGGIVLDPFAGSGTTGVACQNTGRPFILIERTEEYIPIIEARTGIKAQESDLKPLESIPEPQIIEKTVDICDCGGKIVKYAGGRCCQDCLKDYV